MNTKTKLSIEKELATVSNVPQEYNDADFGLLLLLGKRYLAVLDSIATDVQTESNIPDYDEEDMLHSIWKKIREDEL